MVTASLQLLYCLSFLPRSVPDFSVHSRSLFPCILRHSANGKHFAAVGVSQQPLQGFDLAPPAFFRRLHDTHLEPTHIPPRGLPVNGSPCQLRARDRTNSFHCRHLHCLVSRLCKFSRGKDQREVRLLSQPAMKTPVSAPLPSGVRFLSPLLPAFPSVALRLPFLEGRNTGLPCSAEVTR